ncbi:MAG: flagellar export protein FliJ [Deltaproteobacteria bacterium]|jgi:flagellar export protein FliJ|nr:flagellar export protein FliJ [Deltaproteobacteria bacterium]
MAYRFSLETLLNLRKRRLELTEMELMRAEQRLAREAENLELTRKAIEIQRQDMEGHLKKGMMAHELQQAFGILEMLAKAEEMQQQVVSALQKEVKTLKDRRIEQYRDKELLERLKEKDKDKWLAEIARMEQKELDELSTQRHARRTQTLTNN